MTRAQLQEKIFELPAAERLSLAEAIWDSVERERDVVALTNAQQQVVDRRLDEFLANPEGALTWSELQARLSKSR